MLKVLLKRDKTH